MEPANESRFTTNYTSDSKSKMSGGLRRFITYSLLAVVLLLIWTYVNSPLVVTVVGSGEVSVPATNATVSFSLSANDSSINTAVSGVEAKVEMMRTFLKDSGVGEADIAVSQVTAVPAALVSEGASGFQATVTMAAKTSHVTSVGSLISDLYTNGAVVVGQPILSVENEDKLDEEVFAKAMQDAKSQASVIAKNNTKLIKKIILVNQETVSTTSTATTKADTLDSANNSVAATNGVFKIVKKVTVGYKMW